MILFQENKCEFCNDRFRSEASLKMHRYICRKKNVASAKQQSPKQQQQQQQRSPPKHQQQRSPPKQAPVPEIPIPKLKILSPKFSQQIVDPEVITKDVHVFDFEAEERSDVDNRNSNEILAQALPEIGIKLKLTKPESGKVHRKKSSKKKRERASHHLEASSSDEEDQPRAEKSR